jgi:hypothetical protein
MGTESDPRNSVEKKFLDRFKSIENKISPVVEITSMGKLSDVTTNRYGKKQFREFRALRVDRMIFIVHFRVQIK